MCIRDSFCIDPPYFNKGSSLYTSFYKPEDHALLRDTILELDRPWMVTYDNAEEINALYAVRDRYLFNVNYSVQTKRVADELLVTSPGLLLPSDVSTRTVA